MDHETHLVDLPNIPFDSLGPRLTGHTSLLIGGAGFIGHHLALGLAKLGARVVVLDHLGVNNMTDINIRSDIEPVRRALYRSFLETRLQLMHEAGVQLINDEALDPVVIQDIYDTTRPDSVIHLAAISSAVTAAKVPGKAFDLQMMAFRNVLEAIRRHKHKPSQIQFLSSSTIYGDFGGDSVDETTPCHPKGVYAATKRMGELLLEVYHKEYSLSGVSIRPSALYGDRCISVRVSQKFVENALSGKPLLLEGGGSGRLDLTHVSDLVQGMIRALVLHKREEEPGIYNLTYGHARPISLLAEIVKRHVPGTQLLDKPRVESRPVRGTLMNSRARIHLGFKPELPLEDGYSRFVTNYVRAWRATEDVLGLRAGPGSLKEIGNEHAGTPPAKPLGEDEVSADWGEKLAGR